MSKRRVSLVLLCVVAAGAVAAGFAIAGKGNGNDKTLRVRDRPLGRPALLGRAGETRACRT